MDDVVIHGTSLTGTGVKSRLTAMTRHLQYVVDRVGIHHVGVSSDFSFDYADLVGELVRNPHLFDDGYTRWGPIQRMPQKRC
jgi:membrane dipeptidase